MPLGWGLCFPLVCNDSTILYGSSDCNVDIYITNHWARAPSLLINVSDSGPINISPCNMRIPIDQAIPEQTHESRKRKRDDQSIQKSLNSSTKSMSQLSISQAAVPKKTKLSPVETMSSNNEISTQTNSQNYTLYKPSKYLKMPRRLLLHSLHLQLNCPLKKE